MHVPPIPPCQTKYHDDTITVELNPLCQTASLRRNLFLDFAALCIEMVIIRRIHFPCQNNPMKLSPLKPFIFFGSYIYMFVCVCVAIA